MQVSVQSRVVAEAVAVLVYYLAEVGDNSRASTSKSRYCCVGGGIIECIVVNPSALKVQANGREANVR